MPRVRKKDIQEVESRLRDGSLILERGNVYHDPAQLSSEKAGQLNWAILAVTGRRSVTIVYDAAAYERAKVRKAEGSS